ncbi:MAG TPA: PEGA domain-containing protein [Candidatus Angelobacter sp.]|nr:PEGA domain-containing protein [Candidatus Angelobacter sp.]
MSEKIGRFEIVSQLAQSPFATVYKALDPENQQTVALKAVRLEQVKDREALVKSVCDEAESAKTLSSHNIAVLYGVGDENDVLLAATEYVQGNSVATTLARHDGFSIWDIQDIARQMCQALDHAHAHKVGHQSLEPAKIMVGWDGIVKVLGFGISTMNALSANSSNTFPEILYYASPEQLRGEACDQRSALFSLGAVLYEMATEQKPFPGESAEQVRQAILEQVPALPVRLKPNVNRGLSDLIMKALAKSPDERYQSGQQLVRDLENCKSGASTPAAVAAAVQPKPAQMAKAQAAAAGAGLGNKPSTNLPKMTASSSAAPAVEEEKPAFAVDPMMAGGGSAGAAPRSSFSDITELPPLKEVRISTPAPEPEPEEAETPALKPEHVYRHIEIEKSKIQVREAAQKAVAEIRKVPPKLALYAVGGALALGLLIVGGLSLLSYFADRDERGNVAVHSSASPQQAAPQKPPAPVQESSPAPTEQSAAPQDSEPADSAEAQESSAPIAHGRASRKNKTRAVGPVVAPAQLTVDSTPAGAEITFDGSPLCQSPCTLTGIAPGTHSIVASKNGFSHATRNVSLNAGANATVALQLEALSAMLSVASTPAGAVIVVDGKDTGRLTPSQFSLTTPGAHTVTLRRNGYLEASNSINVEAGQTANLNLSLTALGSTDEIHAAGGRFNKVFKKGDASGMGTVSIKTQPKNAQIMVNNRVLDKTTPFDFYLNPGTYVIDVTMSGYRPIHRVISLQEGEKMAIQETLSPE